jgi:hypothetical protein
MKRSILPYLGVALVSAILGCIVAFGTLWLLGVQAKHLPGGSFGAGLAWGWWSSVQLRNGIPRLAYCVVGGLSGVLGWTLLFL